MKIKERLEKETVSRLRQLAKQLNLAGYFRKKKQELIDFIITNRSLKEITAALDVKVLWWKQIKDFTHFYGAITAIGLNCWCYCHFLGFFL